MKKLGLLAVILILGAAVWWLATQGRFAAVDDDAPLGYAPADTPYLIATLEPVPDDVLQQYNEVVKEFAGFYVEMFELMREDLASDPKQNAQGLAVFDALLAEFKGKDLNQSYAQLGLDTKGMMAIYGVGMLPVLRWDVADPAKLNAFIARMEQAAGDSLPRADVDGQAYWKLPLDKAPVIAVLAIAQGDLVLALAPANEDRVALRAVLGLDRPKQNLAASGELAQLADQYGLTRHLIAYLDSRKLLHKVLAEPQAADQAVLAALDITRPELSPVCQTELSALADAWPRLLIGYTHFDRHRNDVLMLVESRKDIASALKKLRAPMPAFQAGDQSLFNIGLSFKVGALPQVVGDFANQAKQAPWQCEQLTGLNKMFAQAAKEVQNPAVYAAAPMSSGFHLWLEQFSLNMQDGEPNPSGKASLAIASDNPQSLVGMAKNFVPGMKDLPTPATGSAVALPALPGTPPDLAPHYAVADKVLLLSSHAPSAAELQAGLQLDETQQPLLLIGVDGKLYAEFGSIIEQATAESLVELEAEIEQADAEQDESADDSTDSEHGDPSAQQQRKRERIQRMAELQTRLFTEVYAKLFGRQVIRVDLTERGIEWLQSTEMP